MNGRNARTNPIQWGSGEGHSLSHSPYLVIGRGASCCSREGSRPWSPKPVFGGRQYGPKLPGPSVPVGPEELLLVWVEVGCLEALRRVRRGCRALKERDNKPWQGEWALWKDTPQEPGQLSPARLWYGGPIWHLRWFNPEMPSNPDTWAEVKENFQKRQEASRCHDSPDNLFKHLEVKWSPRPSSRVLMGNRSNPRLKDSPAIVLSVNPSDRSCRVWRDLDNRTFLLNCSKLVRDPAFADADIIPGVALSGTSGGCNFPQESGEADRPLEVEPRPEGAPSTVLPWATTDYRTRGDS